MIPRAKARRSQQVKKSNNLVPRSRYEITPRHTTKGLFYDLYCGNTLEMKRLLYSVILSSKPTKKVINSLVIYTCTLRRFLFSSQSTSALMDILQMMYRFAISTPIRAGNKCQKKCPSAFDLEPANRFIELQSPATLVLLTFAE